MVKRVYYSSSGLSSRKPKSRTRTKSGRIRKKRSDAGLKRIKKKSRLKRMIAILALIIAILTVIYLAQ